jgi:hypothetical protein
MNREDFLKLESCKATWREDAIAQVAEEIKNGQLRPEKAAEREKEIYTERERMFKLEDRS